MKPDTFTITTFWLDWLLMPIMLAGAWLTVRWARADAQRAAAQQAGGESVLPPWAFAVPLYSAAAAWVIAGFGALIKEDYWEMRVIWAAFLLWTLCCFAGALLLFATLLRRGRKLDRAGILALIGLTLMSFLMVLPGLVDPAAPVETITAIGHLWFLLLAAGVGLLIAGLLLNFPYNYPRFPLGLGGFFLMGWGLSEIAFKQASFPWLVRIWKTRLGLDYLDAFPLSNTWQIAGGIKALLGVASIVVLVLASRRRGAPAGQ